MVAVRKSRIPSPSSYPIANHIVPIQFCNVHNASPAGLTNTATAYRFLIQS
jgi:hypothetical protein